MPSLILRRYCKLQSRKISFCHIKSPIHNKMYTKYLHQIRTYYPALKHAKHNVCHIFSVLELFRQFPSKKCFQISRIKLKRHCGPSSHAIKLSKFLSNMSLQPSLCLHCYCYSKYNLYQTIIFVNVIILFIFQHAHVISQIASTLQNKTAFFVQSISTCIHRWAK